MSRSPPDRVPVITSLERPRPSSTASQFPIWPGRGTGKQCLNGQCARKHGGKPPERPPPSACATPTLDARLSQLTIGSRCSLRSPKATPAPGPFRPRGGNHRPRSVSSRPRAVSGGRTASPHNCPMNSQRSASPVSRCIEPELVVTYKASPHAQAAAPKPSIPSPSSVGPSDHSFLEGSKTFTVVVRPPCSCIPPTQYSLPRHAATASARRLKGGVATVCQAGLSAERSIANAVSCHLAPSPLPCRFQPPTTYTVSPITAASCEDLGSGRLGNDSQVVASARIRANSACAGLPVLRFDWWR